VPFSFCLSGEFAQSDSLLTLSPSNFYLVDSVVSLLTENIIQPRPPSSHFMMRLLGRSMMVMYVFLDLNAVFAAIGHNAFRT